MASPIRHAERLAASNPWWIDPDSINSDEHIVAWDSSRARYVPSIFRDILGNLDADRRILYTIHGSRQVGKTTLVKLMIRDLLGQGIAPTRICYFTLDPRIASKDIVQVVLDYTTMTNSDRENSRSYVFIDEISMAMGWQYAILSLSNMPALSNCAMVVTGSNAIDLTRGTEGIVGKKGMVDGGSHRSLLPMGFLDYACLETPIIRKILGNTSAFSPESRHAIWKNLVEGKEDSTINALRIHFGALNSILHKYVLSGGIPQVVNQYLSAGSIRDRYYTEYLGGIRYEWSRMKYGVDHLANCMEFLVDGTGGTITWSGMAKKIGVSKFTVAEGYTTAIRDMYLALITYFYDVRRDSAVKNKPKKVHVRDPFFFHAFNARKHNENYFLRATKYASDDANFGRLVECAVADHLARHAINMSTDKSQFGVPARLFHWRDRSDREVDFVYRDPGYSPVPIEVKWAGRVNRKRLGGMSAFLDATPAIRGIVATRTEYGIERDYTLVPASLLLLLLS